MYQYQDDWQQFSYHDQEHQSHHHQRPVEFPWQGQQDISEVNFKVSTRTLLFRHSLLW